MHQYFKKSLCFSTVFFLAGCTSIAHQKTPNSSAEKIKSSVVLCAEKHQSTSTQSSTSASPDSFLAIDVDELSYFIIVSEQGVATEKQIDQQADKKNALFCHVDKSTTELVYANGNQPFLKESKGTHSYEARYVDVFTDKASIDNASIAKYTFINGVWRYIEGRTISGS